MYGCYLFFQLKTHSSTYNAPSEKVEKKSLIKKEPANVVRGIAQMGAGNAAVAGGNINRENLVQNRDKKDDDAEEEGEEPSLSKWGALITLCAATALIGLCSEYVVTSIDYVASHNHVPLGWSCASDGSNTITDDIRRIHWSDPTTHRR